MSTNNTNAQNFSDQEIFRKHYLRLCDFACYILKDRDAAEDTVQDAFIAFLEEKNKISSHPTAIKSFLYTAVKNACLNRIRHFKVVDRYNLKYPTATLEDSRILEGIIHAEIISQIHEVINTLPHGCAMVIKYGYLEGLQNHKIAELMNISVNTVKSQKQRALNLMRLRLGESAYLLFLTLFINN